ncbi:hypothetical protein [Microbacterium imperiale]|uniref:hypothetical protein n=1 Tax=Microbacterium imperiale TaxID=33884 RepID=UPI001AE1B1B5|nr:hypothetical protein [Microbacterium imperiale]MBP2422030.1 4'-phosphopantetheinyl transferase [Microbacterium imperiale]MDS0200188.1 hypothetical protein [Microbacterium imperiale]
MLAAPDVRWRRVTPGEDRRRIADELLIASLRDRGIRVPRIGRVCPRCGGAHGPARATDAGAPVDVAVSVSYAGGWAIAATAAGRGAFAIDAELRALDPAARLRLRTALGDDKADAATWTRVEAALKADGRGLRVDPATVRLIPVGDDWLAHVPGRPGALRIQEVAGPAELVISLATAAEAASDRSMR